MWCGAHWFNHKACRRGSRARACRALLGSRRLPRDAGWHALTLTGRIHRRLRLATLAVSARHPIFKVLSPSWRSTMAARRVRCGSLRPSSGKRWRASIWRSPRCPHATHLVGGGPMEVIIRPESHSAGSDIVRIHPSLGLSSLIIFSGVAAHRRHRRCRRRPPEAAGRWPRTSRWRCPEGAAQRARSGRHRFIC